MSLVNVGWFIPRKKEREKESESSFVEHSRLRTGGEVNISTTLYSHRKTTDLDGLEVEELG